MLPNIYAIPSYHVQCSYVLQNPDLELYDHEKSVDCGTSPTGVSEQIGLIKG